MIIEKTCLFLSLAPSIQKHIQIKIDKYENKKTWKIKKELQMKQQNQLRCSLKH